MLYPVIGTVLDGHSLEDGKGVLRIDQRLSSTTKGRLLKDIFHERASCFFNGLKIAIELGVRRLDVRSDSQLIIDQVMKASNYHDPKKEAYCKEVRRLEDKFHGLELVHIARR